MSRSLARRRRCGHTPSRLRLPGPTDRLRCPPHTSCSVPDWQLRHSSFTDRHTFDLDLLLRMPVAGAVGVVTARLCHILDDIESADDGPERRIAGRQLGLLVDEEELAAIAIRLACI